METGVFIVTSPWLRRGEGCLFTPYSEQWEKPACHLWLFKLMNNASHTQSVTTSKEGACIAKLL